MAIFNAANITKEYVSGSATLKVLQGINLSVEAGEMTAIIGASGSGKTTLLQILGTLDSYTSGEIFYRDEPLSKRTAKEMAKFRNEAVGFIFQFHHLLPDFTALENVMMPALIASQSKKEMVRSATELLAQVELSHRLHHKVTELSGGEQQRTALARALIMNPSVLLADEPTGNLDSRAGEIVFNLLHNLCRERNLCTVMVTHNIQLADRMDHCLTLQDGILEKS